MVKASVNTGLLSVPALENYLKSNFGYDMFEYAPPVDVDKIAKLLDINVIESPTFQGSTSLPIGEDTVGLITLKPDGAVTVWINSCQNSYSPRRRFTLAHEIGHFCMHRSGDRLEFVDDKSAMSHSESYWTRHESEANNFAEELLMPAELIRSTGRPVIETYKRENGTTTMPLKQFASLMASRFNVPYLTMESRVKRILGRRD